MLFREGRTRGKGKIVKLYPIDDKKFVNEKKAKAQIVKNQPNKVDKSKNGK